MKNIILALILVAPAIAFAQDPAMRMEAVGGCPECELASTQTNTVPSLQRITNTSISRDPAASPVALTPESLANMIGRIETRYEVTLDGKTGAIEANAVLVSPCHMLTNHHVVFGDERKPDLAKNRDVYFYLGRGATAFKYRLSGKVVNRIRTSTDDSGDYALVHLPTCPGKTLGWIEPKAVSAVHLDNVRFSMAAIPASAADGKIAVQHCTSSGREPGSGRILTTCSSAPGHSGGALIAPDLDENIRLVALNQGVTNSGVARAVTLFEVLSDPQVDARLKADKQAFAAQGGGRTQHASASQLPQSF